MTRLALVLMVLGCASQVEAACPGSNQTTLTTDSPGSQTITWVGGLTCGQYANGDYWIEKPSGSLTITRTSPVPSGGINGCEIDFPGLPVWDGVHSHNESSLYQRKHGIDTRQQGYLASQNSCLTDTVVVATNHTLMLGKSKAVGEIYTSASNKTHYIELVEPITIVSSAPASGDFRPGFASTSKASPGNKSSIHYERLLNWTITGGPSQVQAESLMRYMIFQHTIGPNQQQDFTPTRNVGYNAEKGAYGKNSGAAVVDVLTYLSTTHSNAEKETMAIRLIQQGIDIYSQYQAGFMFQNAAGFVWPAKSILLISASLMNNATWAAAVKTSVIGVQHWDEDQTYFTVRQVDIDTPRVTNCADNTHAVDTYCIHTTGPTNWNYSYRAQDLGKYDWCDNYFHYIDNGSDCSRYFPAGYSWIASHHIPIALFLSKMSLLDEFDNAAYYGYIFGVNAVDNRSFYHAVAVDGWFGGCTYPIATVSASNAAKTYMCALVSTHFNDTAIDSSITGGGASNVPPALSLTSPSSSTTQTTTAATIALAGTSSDSDGTVSSVVATADCDASVTATGTVSAWTRTVDLPANTACTVTITATDDDAATTVITVSVLRSSGTCTGLSDTFALSGTWGTPNPNCWTLMTGALQWTNNELHSNAAVRNLYYYNQAIADDQQAAWTVNFVPDASNWAYAQVRISAGYSGYSCTAQNPTSFIARWDSGTRVQLGAGFASTWTSGQTLACQATGTSICLLQNGASLGCETDATYASGFTGAGLWGVGGAGDNYVATALSGGGDVIPPLVAITTPTTNPLIVTAQPYTLAAGTASDAVGVATCTWLVVEFPSVNGSCGGTALPATSVSWTIASVALDSTGLANNTIQVTVADAAGNTATTSTVIRYVPGGPGGSWTYPNTEAAWTQKGRVVQLEGTFQAGVCDYVSAREATDPTTGLEPVIATGTDTWSVRVAVPPGTTNVVVSCMDDNGTGGDLTDDVSLLDRIKVVTSIKSRQRR